MPAQDRRGPLGEGPKSGRGLGLCNPEAQSLTENYIHLGRGRAVGRRGRGMGFRNRYFSNYRSISSEEQLEYLKAQKESLSKQIEELEQSSNQ